jgi:hypothetical protein
MLIQKVQELTRVEVVLVLVFVDDVVILVVLVVEVVLDVTTVMLVLAAIVDEKLSQKG